jgi:hypothetical protein
VLYSNGHDSVKVPTECWKRRGEADEESDRWRRDWCGCASCLDDDVRRADSSMVLLLLAEEDRVDMGNIVSVPCGEDVVSTMVSEEFEDRTTS